MDEQPRYQDLIIKDGKFVGQFEEMYQTFDDPWGQTKQGYVENSVSRQVACSFIKIFEIESLVECGCGLGKTTKFIHDETKVQILGIDISETSISKSKSTYPELLFEVNSVENILDYGAYQCFFFSEITWYLLEDSLIDRVFDKMRRNLRGRFFLHNLVFYKGRQKYGRDYFTSLSEFVEFCPFQLLGTIEINLEHSDTIETSSIYRI